MKRLRWLLSGIAASAAGAVAFAGSGERTISFYHIHTKETLTVTFKRDGKFIPEAMKKIDWVMRDWRKNESIAMDPGTIDLIWEMHRELGSKEPVHIISGYRSRTTNNMLRKNVGGQASNSQHITGKAIDVAFPDIPARQLRYSAMIRERGGVGYYPTSAIAFVHVDTARVRHWPNMPRDELALLFPSGRTKHRPADGGSINPSDVAKARKRAPETAQQVAAFFDLRERAKTPVLVADASGKAPARTAAIKAPAPQRAKRPEKPAATRVALASLPPATVPAPVWKETPRLVAAPQLVERSSSFTPAPASEATQPTPRPAAPSPSAADRDGLDRLVELAALEGAPMPKGDSEPAAPFASVAPASKPKPLSPLVASLGPSFAPPGLRTPPPDRQDIAGQAPAAHTEGWAVAPEFDEDHPEELYYRPFPLAPLLTASASADDAALTGMIHPDVAKTVEMLDDVGSVLPMRFRPGQQTAELLWSKEFRGQAVHMAELMQAGGTAPPPLLAERRVKTSAR